MHLPVPLLSLSLATFLLSPCLVQAEEKKLTPAVEMELDYVRSLAEDLRTKAKAPLTELDDKYRGAVEKIRDEALRAKLSSDPHSPSALRVNGVFRNVDAWYVAFGVRPGDRLYLAPGDRIRIW